MKKLLILIGLFSVSFACAQNLKPNRLPFALKVQVNSKQFYAQQISDSPYFAEEKTLQLYPDEKVFIEAVIEDANISSLISVSENLHPEKTFVIEFCQTIVNNISTSSELYIKNPFEKKLKYNCLVYVIDSSSWEPQYYVATSKMTTKKSWDTILGSIVIKDWILE